MKQISVRGPHKVVLEEAPTPDIGPDDVLVRVLATGICGTDVEIVHGTMPYYTRGMASYPMTPGHEWVGEVVSHGGDVRGFAAGDRVVGECSVGCMSCDRCLSGNYHRCLDRHETGILRRPGAFAEYIAFPALFLHKITKDIDVNAAALVEPTAVAFNGVKAGGVGPRDYLAIHGDGPIGLLLLMVARAFGAKKIAMVGMTPVRLEMAGKLGADIVIQADKEDVADALARGGNGAFPDVAIEATGVPAASAMAINTVSPGGRVVLQGMCGGQKLPDFDLDQIVINDISVKGALGSPNIWPDVIALIESRRVDPTAIVTHTLPLDQFEQGLGVVTGREGIKVVIAQ
ncbi:MAG: alcohol dehydrogenase catalytic domain-containing protein [Bauldia sp.]|nr:alcohol dehydrogenase catalytic domain-containing protein [Bauldia sp.]